MQIINLYKLEKHMKFYLVYFIYIIDENERKDYDYYLEHPESFTYNQFRYYRYRYAPKTDLRIVLLVVIIITTSIQYVQQHKRYDQAKKYLRQYKEVRLRAEKLFLEKEPKLYEKYNEI